MPVARASFAYDSTEPSKVGASITSMNGSSRALHESGLSRNSRDLPVYSTKMTVAQRLRQLRLEQGASSISSSASERAEFPSFFTGIAEARAGVAPPVPM